jgi:hypothetical protein
MKQHRFWHLRVPFARLILAAAVIAVPAIGRSTVAGVDAAAESASHSSAASSVWNLTTWDAAALGDIDWQVFSTAFEAAAAAVSRGDVVAPATLTVIDFTRPSTRKRMWVFDLRSHALLFDEWVSHGRGSGQAMATSFSNEPETNKSSLGLFRAGEAYMGKNGYSLRLDGLEPGINDRARERAIVIHGAPYVNAAVARVQGYLGRSLGCPAVRPAIARPLIDAVKDGGLLFAYGATSR